MKKLGSEIQSSPTLLQNIPLGLTATLFLQNDLSKIFGFAEMVFSIGRYDRQTLLRFSSSVNRSKFGKQRLSEAKIKKF